MKKLILSVITAVFFSVGSLAYAAQPSTTAGLDWTNAGYSNNSSHQNKHFNEHHKKHNKHEKSHKRYEHGKHKKHESKWGHKNSGKRHNNHGAPV